MCWREGGVYDISDFWVPDWISQKHESAITLNCCSCGDQWRLFIPTFSLPGSCAIVLTDYLPLYFLVLNLAFFFFKSWSKDGNIYFSSLAWQWSVCQSISWPQTIFFFLFMSSDVKSQMFSCETKLEREKGFVLPKAFKDKPMKIIHVHLKEEQIRLLIRFEKAESRGRTGLKHWRPCSFEAKRQWLCFIRNCYYGSNHLMGSSILKHLVAFGVRVVSFLSWWTAALWRLIRVAAYQRSLLRLSCVLCCDWMLMKHFVLPHRVFTCPSDTRLPIRRRISGPPLSFGRRSAQPSFWGRSDTKPKWFVALQHAVGCSCEEFQLNISVHAFQTHCAQKKNPCCKTRTRLSSGAPILSCMSNNQIGVLPNYFPEISCLYFLINYVMIFFKVQFLLNGRVCRVGSLLLNACICLL